MTSVVGPQVIIGKRFLPAVTLLIEDAKQTIDIIIYDWRIRPTQTHYPGTVLLHALQAAATRGVRVRVLTSSATIVQQLRYTGLECKILYTEKLMHAKMMLIDGRKAIVGSHNYTQSAFTSNLEISLAVQLEHADNDLSQYFKNLWGV